jgi:hypothetical protein
VNELPDHVAGVRADVADELDHAGVQLALDSRHSRGEPLGDGRRAVDHAAVDRIDEEQLLLGAERERRALAKGVLGDSGHVIPIPRNPEVSSLVMYSRHDSSPPIPGRSVANTAVQRSG